MLLCLPVSFTLRSLLQRRLQDDLPPPLLVLGHPAEDLRVHLRLHHARPHHHCLLRPHDPAAQECAHALRLPGERGIRFYSLTSTS